MRALVAASVFVTLVCGRVSSPTPQSGSLSIRGVVTDRKFGQPVPHAVIWAWRGSKRRCSSPAEFVAPADTAGWFALSVRWQGAISSAHGPSGTLAGVKGYFAGRLCPHYQTEAAL